MDCPAELSKDSTNPVQSQEEEEETNRLINLSPPLDKEPIEPIHENIKKIHKDAKKRPAPLLFDTEDISDEDDLKTQRKRQMYGEKMKSLEKGDINVRYNDSTHRMHSRIIIGHLTERISAVVKINEIDKTVIKGILYNMKLTLNDISSVSSEAVFMKIESVVNFKDLKNRLYLYLDEVDELLK